MVKIRAGCQNKGKFKPDLDAAFIMKIFNLGEPHTTNKLNFVLLNVKAYVGYHIMRNFMQNTNSVSLII